MTVSTISKWIQNRQVFNTEDGTVTMQDFKKLQKEIAQVKRERDIKVAVIILGKHSQNKKS